jgi:hypothetical protein
MDYGCFSSMSVCGSCWVWEAIVADLSGGRMPFSCGGIKRKVAGLAFSSRQGAAGCRTSQERTYGTMGSWGPGCIVAGYGYENQRQPGRVSSWFVSGWAGGPPAGRHGLALPSRSGRTRASVPPVTAAALLMLVAQGEAGGRSDGTSRVRGGGQGGDRRGRRLPCGGRRCRRRR